MEAEDYETANDCKQMIDNVRKAGEQLRILHMEKKKAIEEEDYEKANGIKNSIENHRKQLDELISFSYDTDDNRFEENEFVEQSHPPINDFQDNEFVDPEMNEIIEKSAVSSNKGQNSRILAGNSRIKINKSMLKR